MGLSLDINSFTDPKVKRARLSDAARVIQASYAALPSPEDMSVLIQDSHNAEARGYYDPIEDERLRETYTRYLAIRVSIWEMIHGLQPGFARFETGKEKLTQTHLRAFAIAFCGAEIIVRTGEYLIKLARERDIVWQKLDEEEPRYGLKRKSFTRLYRQLTSAFKMHRFYAACDYYDRHKDAITQAMQTDELKPLIAILHELNLPGTSRGSHLRRYKKFVDFSLRRRRISSGRKSLFVLFKETGSDIADMKIPLVKAPQDPKRVTPEIIKQTLAHLKPGDVFITRHDDAMSNLFLPGFWPHGALYIGEPEWRAKFNLLTEADNTTEVPLNILEAKKDGVLLRNISETLHLDNFVVLRPNLSQTEIKKALKNGLSHSGKLYDFVFDFATSDRLVCTEVIYRSFYGVGDIAFELSTKAGRKCLSAEDFLNQAIVNGWFSPVMIFGVNGDRLHIGDDVIGILRDTFDAKF